MIKAVIFDWHGVLDASTFQGFVQRLSELSGLPKTEVEVRLSPFEQQYIVGEMEPTAFWNKLQEVLGLTDYTLTKAQEYRTSIEKNKGLWEVISSKLKGRYLLAILSDVSQDKVDVIRSEVELALFAVIHFSCEKHLSKKKKEFFLDVVHELNVLPEECLYVDDNEQHIQTANELGFHTYLFGTNDVLLSLLK